MHFSRSSSSGDPIPPIESTDRERRNIVPPLPLYQCSFSTSLHHASEAGAIGISPKNKKLEEDDEEDVVEPLFDAWTRCVESSGGSPFISRMVRSSFIEARKQCHIGPSCASMYPPCASKPPSCPAMAGGCAIEGLPMMSNCSQKQACAGSAGSVAASSGTGGAEPLVYFKCGALTGCSKRVDVDQMSSSWNESRLPEVCPITGRCCGKYPNGCLRPKILALGKQHMSRFDSSVQSTDGLGATRLKKQLSRNRRSAFSFVKRHPSSSLSVDPHSMSALRDAFDSLEFPP